MTLINLSSLKKYVSISLPKRFWIAVLMFFGTLSSYMMRVNLTIILIAMVNPTNSTVPVPNLGPRYDWNAHDQSNLLGAFAYGYLLLSLPSGMLAEMYGPRLVAGIAFLIATVLTALLPIAAGIGFWFIWSARFLIGVALAVTYPCCHNLISKWAPGDEKGKFVAALMGGTFGTVVTWPICGFVTDNFGWAMAFYVSAVICGIITLMWFLIVRDSPDQDNKMSQKEKDYIEESIGQNLSKKHKYPPFLSAFTSLPFLALLILHYGNVWGLFFVVTSTPQFMSNVLGFKLTESGFLSALPNLARIFFSFTFGPIADLIKRRNLMSVTMTRKSFTLISHIIPGGFLFLLAFFGTNPVVAITFMTLSLGCNGAAVATNLQNSQDLAPNFAASLYGIINFVGSSSGFFSPMVVAHFTSEGNTMDEWRNVFIVGGSIYIIAALIFMVFGSGEVQKWNNIENKEQNKEQDKEQNKSQNLEECKKY